MSTADQAIENIVLVHGAFADGSGWRGVYDRFGYLNAAKFKIGFAADLSDADAAFLRDAQVPINMSVFSTELKAAAWHDKPTWAVIGTDDNAFDQAMLQHMASRIGAEITDVAASHALYVSQAGVVTEVIATAAQNAAVHVG